jgi:hypothetical protein
MTHSTKRKCTHPNTPEHRGPDGKGKCRTCHRQRSLDYWNRRGNERRAERERLAKEKRGREQRTAERIAGAPTRSLSARDVYQLEKARRMAEGKRVLRTYDERRAEMPEWAR